MASNSNQTLELRLRENFKQFVKRREARLHALLQTVRIVRNRGWTCYAFGGTPRGVLDAGTRYLPRDIDLVFEDGHFDSFASAFESSIVRRNRFGGLNLRIDSLVIDAWPLSSTWAFREGHVPEASFENLPKTTFLNVDAVVVEFVASKGKTRRLYEAGFFSAWQNRLLDINLLPNPFPALCVVRTLYTARRFGLKLSNRLASYMVHLMSELSPQEIFQAEQSHYGNKSWTADGLRLLRETISERLSLCSAAPVALFDVRRDQLEFRFPLSCENKSHIADDQVYPDSPFGAVLSTHQPICASTWVRPDRPTPALVHCVP